MPDDNVSLAVGNMQFSLPGDGFNVGAGSHPLPGKKMNINIAVKRNWLFTRMDRKQQLRSNLFLIMFILVNIIIHHISKSKDGKHEEPTTHKHRQTHLDIMIRS